MKRFFFLPTFMSLGLLVILLYAFFKLHIVLLIPLILIISFLLFIFRRGYIPYRDTVRDDSEIYMAPVHGKVQSIRFSVTIPDFDFLVHEIRISMSVWDEKGLYLPTTGEVNFLKASKGKKTHRDSLPHYFYGPVDELSHTDFNLISKFENKTLIRFIDCVYGKRPSIWLKSGDRGRAGACFGYYPFGGSLLIYLPATSDVLVYEQETIVPSETVIGTLKDKTKV